MDQETLVDTIITYAGDKGPTGQFAIVLYGQWGSGKTYFCEHTLKVALKKSNIKICRVSLFGVTSFDEICERVLIAYCNVGAKTRISTLSEIGIRSGIGVLKKILHSTGIEVALSPRSAVTLLDMKDRLTIFDDIERSGFKEGEQLKLLFGYINDMVENNGWHVMIVRNEPFTVDASSSEKVISRQLNFAPSIESIYQAIVGDYFESIAADFDVKKPILLGLEASGIVNARALAKVMPFLREVLASEVLSDTSIAAVGRAETLSDITRFGYQVVAGKPPVQLAVNVDGDPSKESLTLRWERIKSQSAYEMYQKLIDILDPLEKGEIPSRENIERVLGAYISRYHPGTAEDRLMQELWDTFQQLPEREDEEAIRISKALKKIFAEGNLPYSWMVKSLRMAQELYSLGFDEAPSPDEAYMAVRKRVDADPSAGYEALLAYKYWALAGEPSQDAADELLEYAEQRYDEIVASGDTYDSAAINPNSGTALAKTLERHASGKKPLMHLVPPDYICACLKAGDVQSQMALHRFFRSILPLQYTNYPDHQDLLEPWLEQIASRLETLDCGTKLGNLRINYVKNDVGDLIEAIEKNHAQTGQTDALKNRTAD